MTDPLTPFPSPRDSSSSPASSTVAAAAPSPMVAPTVDPASDARWAAWIARGHQHEAAGRRALGFVVLAVAIVAGLAALGFRSFGGSL